jgi:hypothetical protein
VKKEEEGIFYGISPFILKKSSNLENFFSTTFVLVPATGTFQVFTELFYGLNQL